MRRLPIVPRTSKASTTEHEPALKILLGILLAAAASLLSAYCKQGPSGLTFLAECDFENGAAESWRPNDPAHWRVVGDNGSTVYELTAPGEPGKVRAPTSWSLWTDHDVASFEFTGRVRCHTDPATKVRDMCVFFHFQDPEHFYYVHFAGSSDEVHNIIGLVDGADRVKINAEPAGTSVFRLTDREWHAFKVVCNAETGEIRAYLDDMTKPILTARDRTLGHGLVGVGSFDDIGAFDDLKLRAARENSLSLGHFSPSLSLVGMILIDAGVEEYSQAGTVDCGMTIRNMMKALLNRPEDAPGADPCILAQSPEELEAAIKSRDRLMVLFYASWCPFSQAFLGTYRNHAATGEPCYMRILADDGDPVATKYSIDVFPTVLYFEKGKVVKRLDGVYHRGLSKGQLEDFARPFSSV